MRIVVIAILIYFAFQFIFKFLVPVVIASRKFKKGFGEMQEHMQEQVRQQQEYTPQSSQTPQKQSPPKSDYIEFEEV